MKKSMFLAIVVLLMLSIFTLGIRAFANNESSGVKIEAGRIEKIEDGFTINILYPKISGFDAAAKLNSLIRNKNIALIGNIRYLYEDMKQITEEMKKAGEKVYKSDMDIFAESDYDYSLNGSILSITMNESTYSGGAHGSYGSESFTVNTKTNEIYTFNSLFNQKSNFKNVILKKINTMIDKEKEAYFEDAKKTLAGRNTNDYQFYFDGSNLVVYFGLYDLRPYAGGISEFSIPVKELKGLLKNEIYSQVINAKPLNKTTINGTNFNVDLKTFMKNYTLMVPLKPVAETLGYKVTWNQKKGAGIAGGYVKNNINSYYTDKSEKTPVKLAVAPMTVNNVLYVPLEYFKDVLKEDIRYDGKTLRIYKLENKEQNQFDSQITEFVLAASAEQCAQMYAKAVKERNGALQYALYSDNLRQGTEKDFENTNWVTGFSSPWVDSYDIKADGKGVYSIVFHWATSTGKEKDSTIKLTVEKTADGEYWQISAIK
jgi:hypothetical protein